MSFVELCNFDGHVGGTSSVWIGRRSCKWVASGGKDRTVKLWSLKFRQAQLSLQGHTAAISKVLFNNEEETVLAATADGVIKLWDMQAGKGGADSALKHWDFRQQICIHTYSGHIGPVSAVRFSPDGRLLVSGSHDGVVKVWDLTAAKLIKSFHCHSGKITGLEYHPHEYMLGASCSDGQLLFWDLDTFTAVGGPAHLSTGIRSIAFAKSGLALHSITDEEVTTWAWEPTRQIQTCFHRWDHVADFAPQKENQMVVANVKNEQIMVVLADTMDSDIQVDGKGRRDSFKSLPQGVIAASAIVLEQKQKCTTAIPRQLTTRSPQKGLQAHISEQSRGVRVPMKSAFVVETTQTPQKTHRTTCKSIVDRTESGKYASTSDASISQVPSPRQQTHNSGLSKQNSYVQTINAPLANQQGNKPCATSRPTEECLQADCAVRDRIMDRHRQFMEVLNERQCHLQVVSTFWKRNDVRGTLSSLQRCTDTSVTHDVLSAIGKEYHFKLDYCPQVVSLLIPMFESSEAHHRATAVTIATSLLQRHNQNKTSHLQVIRNHLSCTYERARDLAFAERLDSCTAARNALRSILQHLDGSSKIPCPSADTVLAHSTPSGVTGRLVQELQSL